MVNIIKIAFGKGYSVTNSGDFLNPQGESIGYKGVYVYTKIRHNGKAVEVMAHRLQAYQKYGDKIFENGICVRHKDGNSKNNSWDNILIGTQQENMLDIPEHVRIAKAIHASSFLKKHDKSSIIEWHKENGKSYKKTMEHFNISSKGTLHYILNK